MLIPVIAFILLSTTTLADVAPKPSSKELGYTKTDIELLQKERSEAVDSQAIIDHIAYSFEVQGLPAAVHADQAMGAVIGQTVKALAFYGYGRKANKIAEQYERLYKSAYSDKLMGEKEIGDHPPLNVWVEDLHNFIEDELGEYLCVFFHLHDMFILNHGVPVVMHPESHNLKEYNDHFAGHLKDNREWVFIHHGVAGVVSYWGVNVACVAGTAGLGMSSSVCGPMSTAAEVLMDKFIAPPLGERVWTKVNGAVK